ncbi:MAG: sterol desaturase family protein [Saprospiraceae bacterium]|nr:sterol desaturase family protein [Saprospiraceae bacterium]
MEPIVDYFTNIPSSHRSAILLGGLTFFLLLEGAVPLFRWKYNKWSHAGINLFFTATTILVNFLMAFILLSSSDWVVAARFGILQWLPDMPLLLYTVVGLLLLDLVGAYFVHWAEHKVKWMWKFHLVHHTDTNVDTTTANRHHPGESVFRFIFTTLGVIVCGAPIYLIFLYQSLSAALSQFNHANIQFPKWLDDVLSWVIVTPRMHRVHHHYVLPYTDTNYGNIFSIWDRLFGTFAKMDNDRIVFGIDTHMAAAEHSHIGNLLKIPFERYRPPVGAKFKGESSNEPPAGL